MEQKYSVGALFVTLTYSDDHLNYLDPLTGEVCYSYDDSPTAFTVPMKRDVQLFMKRYRKWMSQNSPCRFKYYIVSEFGMETLRPHYHAIFFYDSYVIPPSYHPVADLWKLGNVYAGTVSAKSCAYTTKYHILAKSPSDEIDSRLTFALMSKGIGRGYVDDWTQDMVDLYDTRCIKIDGFTYPFPRYWKDRLRRQGLDVPEDEYRYNTAYSEFVINNPKATRKDYEIYCEIVQAKRLQYSTENFREPSAFRH